MNCRFNQYIESAFIVAVMQALAFPLHSCMLYAAALNSHASYQ